SGHGDSRGLGSSDRVLWLKDSSFQGGMPAFFGARARAPFPRPRHPAKAGERIGTAGGGGGGPSTPAPPPGRGRGKGGKESGGGVRGGIGNIPRAPPPAVYP